ncbi:hypothetical protein HDU96_010892, partial [Phlyctochytrium bullatum]
SECQKLPVSSEKYPDLVSYKCKDEAVKVSDDCVFKVKHDGSFTYPWTFNFPKLPNTPVVRTSEPEPEPEPPKPVGYSGSARTYNECRELLLKSESECQKLPVSSEKYPDLVSYKCKDEAVKVSDDCVFKVKHDGSFTYPWTFNFPKLPNTPVVRTSEPEPEPPKPVWYLGSAKTYNECQDLLAKSGSECQKLPEWSQKYPDFERYKCKDAAVKFADACVSKVRPDGSIPYPWTFSYPPTAPLPTTLRQILVTGYVRRLSDCQALGLYSEYECRVLPDTRPDTLQTRSDCKAAVAPQVRACVAAMNDPKTLYGHRETYFSFRYNWVSTPLVKVNAEDPSVTITGPAGGLKLTVVEGVVRGEEDCKRMWGEADKACEEVPKSPREDGLNWDTFQGCRESMAKSAKMCYQTFREKPGVPRNERFSFAWVVPGTLRMKVKEVKAPWM